MTPKDCPKATLALEDGLVFEGRSVGADGEATGELVFNTALTGYQEVLTDPSYAGQIVAMRWATDWATTTRAPTTREAATNRFRRPRSATIAPPQSAW